MDWKNKLTPWEPRAHSRKTKAIFCEQSRTLEKKLKQFPAISGARDMDEAISIILSGKTYVQDGIFISIFQDDKIFNTEYRTKWMDDAKHNNQWLKPMMRDFLEKKVRRYAYRSVYHRRIRNQNSTGRPTHQRKFQTLCLLSLNAIYDELGRFDPVAQENFRQEMYLNLKVGFRTRICSNAASLYNFQKKQMLNNRNMLMELVKDN